MERKFSIVYRWKPGLAIIVFLLLFLQSKVFGQEFPPRPIISVTVSLAQNLNFGTFYPGANGGTVIIYSNGSHSVTGDVVHLGGTITTGVYDVVANRGTKIAIYDVNAILTGSNGGTMTLQIRNTDLSQFIIPSVPPASTEINIGGTLVVGNPLANPPGNYSGTFNVTFFQE